MSSSESAQVVSVMALHEVDSPARVEAIPESAQAIITLHVTSDVDDAHFALMECDGSALSSEWIAATATLSFTSSDQHTALNNALLQAFENRSSRTCDVRLFAGQRFIRVHRALLAALSPLLRSIISDLDPYQSKEVDISLSDIKYSDLEDLVRFIYTGTIEMGKRRCRLLQKWLSILGMELTLKISPSVEEKNACVGSDPSCSDPSASDETITPRAESTIIVRRASASGSEKTCELCEKTFKSESSLKAHRLNIHENSRAHNCAECGKAFRYKEMLMSHLREHSGQVLKCSHCDKTFKHLRDLKDHENVHSETLCFRCDICALEFKSKKQMYNHREAHKTHLAPCDVCGKRLKNEASFRAHLKNHSRTAAHTCDTCGRAFKRGFDLKVHLRIHSGSKPYECDVCQKTFSLSSTLAKHKRFHLGQEGLPKCAYCSQAFNSTKSLSQHVRQLHDAEVV